MGGEFLRKIYFQKEDELIYCCDVLFQSEKAINISWEQEGDSRHVLLIEDTVHPNTWVHCLVIVYLTCRLQEKITDIAKSVYFYENPQPLKKIYNKTNLILQDDHYVKTIFPKEDSLYEALFTLFKEQLYDMQEIYFDSFIIFSMTTMDEKLIQAVGFGIDEMKRDEVHEQFISNVKQFMRHRPDQTDSVYVLMKKEPLFFQATGMIYDQQQLIDKMKTTPLYLLQLDINETFISPLIALAPKNIYLYTERPIEARVYSLCRIFNRKIQVLSLEKFPFVANVK